MNLPNEATLLRIYLGESDHHEGKPLYEAIALKAREFQMAGATVLRGVMGFGKSTHLHTGKILQLSMDLPLVVEIVDTEEKIQAFLAEIGPLLGPGLATLEKIRVVHYHGVEKAGG